MAEEVETAKAAKDEEFLVSEASSWCASHGVLMGSKSKSKSNTFKKNSYTYEPAPFSLRPTPFPRSAYEKVYSLQKSFHSIVHKASMPSNYGMWLRDAIDTAARGDEHFTGKLVQLADEVAEAGNRAQNVVLGILRSDYMLHSEVAGDSVTGASAEHGGLSNAIPLQVELNTIASSFGCLSTKISNMHKYLEDTAPVSENKSDLPANGAAEGITAGLAAAFHEYVRQRKEMLSQTCIPDNEPDLVVVMVVQPGETNSCDQRDLEFLLHQKHGIRMIRRSLHDIATTGSYNPNSNVFQGKELLLPDDITLGDGLVAAAVVYYRAGYTPDDYPTQSEWDARGLVERSGSIKCPDVFYHLFGSKKVQQVLAEPGVLRKFCSSDEEEKLVSSSFASLYALGEGDDSHAVQVALANPHGYVLKPQREGGGNNLYDDDLVQALKTMTYEERGAFILMQKIMSPSSAGKLVRNGDVVHRGKCVCELGVFGVTLRRYDCRGKEDAILLDQVVGHILRSKSAETNEGGVAAGYAFLSSPVLI